MEEKLKVLHLVANIGFVGAGSSLSPFFKFTNRRFFEVSVGAYFSSDPRRVSLMQANGTKVKTFHGDHNAFLDYMKENSIDILHFTRAGNENSDFFNDAAVAKVPIRTELNVFGLYDSTTNDSLIDMHLLQSKTATLRYLTHARMTMERFVKRGRVLYLPIDVDRFDELRPTESQRRLLKDRLDLPVDASIVCRVGRPDFHKWSLFSIHALTLLVDRFPDVRFLIVGGIPGEVKSRIRKWGMEKYFRIIEEVSDDDLIRILHCIDVLAHSSHIGESFGAAIAQAMAAKKPVVVNSTDWADNAQIELVENGVTGFVANTPRAYADALVRLLTNVDLSRRMGQEGYEKVKREFSAASVTTILEKTYSELADTKNVRSNQERSEFYKSIPYRPDVRELLQWPYEYQRRLRESGYSLGPFGKTLIRSAWMSTNIFQSLRLIRIPKTILRGEGLLSYVAAVT